MDPTVSQRSEAFFYESDWDPHGPPSAINLELIWRTPEQRYIMLLARELLRLFISDVWKGRSDPFTELARDLYSRFNIRRRSTSLEIAQIVWLGQAKDFRDYYAARSRNRIRHQAFKYVYKILRKDYPIDTTEHYHEDLFFMICRGAGREEYYVRYGESLWYDDYHWADTFGSKDNLRDERLRRFIEEVEEVTPFIMSQKISIPISPRHEIAVDLHRFLKIRGLDFCHEIAELLWHKISRERRNHYRSLARHRHKTVFCKLVEDHLKPKYLALGFTDVPQWRPAYKTEDRFHI